MKTENKIEIRELSMFIMKSFEIRKKTLLFWLVCPARFPFVYTCSWFVDMWLYLDKFRQVYFHYIQKVTDPWGKYM